MAKRSGPKKAFKAYPQTPDLPPVAQPKAPERPAPPDYPMFGIGPVRACEHGCYIWG